MKVAAIDLGSNTFLLLIVTIKNRKVKTVHRDECEYVRLGQEVHETGKFAPEALERVESCFSKFRKIMDSENVQTVQAVATSAAREAKNKEEFLALGKQYGIPINIIKGSEEAKLTFLGCLDNQISDSQLVVDLGGYSTELTYSLNSQIHPTSLNVGAVRLLEKFSHEIGDDGSLSESLCGDMQKEVMSLCHKNSKNFPRSGFFSSIWAVGGTAVALEQLSSKPLDVEVLGKLISMLSFMDSGRRKEILRENRPRFDTIVPGAIILRSIAIYWELRGYKVSHRGVRYGLAFSLVS